MKMCKINKPSRFLALLLLKFKPLRSTRGTISVNLRKFLLFLGLFLLGQSPQSIKIHILSLETSFIFLQFVQIGRFKHLVDSLVKIKAFKAKYHIPQEVALGYCAPDQLLTHREEGEIIIPMIAFIVGGMTLPMGRIT